ATTKAARPSAPLPGAAATTASDHRARRVPGAVNLRRRSMSKSPWRAPARGVLLSAATVLVAGVAFAQSSAVDEIAKYRAALQDGNPAELWEARGEGLWKTPRGPNKVTLEKCDLGLGPGVVKG